MTGERNVHRIVAPGNPLVGSAGRVTMAIEGGNAEKGTRGDTAGGEGGGRTLWEEVSETEREREHTKLERKRKRGSEEGDGKIREENGKEHGKGEKKGKNERDTPEKKERKADHSAEN